MNSTSKVCVTCLSNDRNLTPLKPFLIQDINFQVHNSNGCVCWECHSILNKIQKFKLQVKIAQETLKTNQILSPLSSLSSKLNIEYDYVYNFSDPLTSQIEPKLELALIKEENQHNSDENDDYDDDDDDDKTIQEIILNTNKNSGNIIKKKTIQNKKVKKIKKREKVKTSQGIKHNDRKKVTNTNSEHEKFSEVVYTQDEMLRSREEKRNHPNYKKIPYKCDSCVLGFTRQETYEFHIKKKHDESIGTHICDVCQMRFANATALEKHRLKHYMFYRCKLCGHESSELWTAINHCKIKHSSDTIEKIHCSQCDVIVKSPEELKDHMQKDHRLHCNECGVKFIGMNTLRRHKARIHAIKREFICDVCTKTFMTKSRLESHMVSHNETIARRLAYCHTCRVQYKNIYVYRSHLKHSANHSERMYSCPKCNKKFASKVYWNRHFEFYHLKKSRFHCEICNKLFISDWRLKNHKQKHHGLSRSRDHACNICGKKFFTISTLRGHHLTHSEERSYMCEDCGDTFKQRPALYTHAKLVHSRGRGK